MKICIYIKTFKINKCKKKKNNYTTDSVTHSTYISMFILITFDFACLILDTTAIGLAQGTCPQSTFYGDLCICMQQSKVPVVSVAVKSQVLTDY